MDTEQASLFDQRRYKGIAAQARKIEPPAGDHSVTRTLLAYYAYLQSGGYSKYTPADFTSDIKKFGMFVKDKPLQSIQTTDIQQWIGALKKTMTAKTVSRKLAALNNYFAWLEGQGVVTNMPMRSIMRTRVTSPLPEVLFAQEARQLQVVASRDPRTYMLVMLLLETGMKKAELFTLKTTHFDFSDTYAPEVWI
jgi:site-specific recombinase XerD